MNRVGRFFRRGPLDSELAAEIAAHIEEMADDLIESGMSREEALQSARAHFGNRTALLEQSREVWSFMPLETLLRDLRIGVRSLRRTPLFTAVAIATLALGIGANTAIFTVIDKVLLRPLPFPESDRIVMLWEKPPKEHLTASPLKNPDQNTVSPANFMEWKSNTHAFTDMAAILGYSMGVSGVGAPRAVNGQRVSAAFFRILGVAPLLGRTFDQSEDVPNGADVVVLGYDLWQTQFGGDRAVVGRTISLLDQPFRIIGVMPRQFDLPFAHAELWVPVQIVAGDTDNGRYLSVMAKLKPGVSLRSASADVDDVERQIGRERPRFARDWGAWANPLYRQTTGEVSTALLLLFGAVTFVLLIAAGNVANLLLMRGAQRRREIAVRAALGASRSRIAAQLLAESLILSLAGGIPGIAVAFYGLNAISASLPALGLPAMERLYPNAQVLLFSAGLSLVTALLFGLAPALAFSRVEPDDALKQSGVRITGRAGRRIRGALVAVEVALSLVLLTGAGLLARSFLNQITVVRGYRADHILTVPMFFAPTRYHDNERRARYVGEMLERIRALPGVEAASSADMLPMTGMVSGSGFRRLDRPEPPPGAAPTADFLVVSPQYFKTMGIPMISGREFDEGDTISKEPSIIVNQTFARKYFPGENPLGHALGLDWSVRHGVIVGVSADARQTDLKVDPRPVIILAQSQSPRYFGALVARTAARPETMANAVVRAVHEVDPDQAVSDVESMEQVEGESVARPRLESVLLSVFAGIALLLAMIGLYGVLAYSVAQRTREIGIRMALGADARQLVKDVAGDGLRLMLPGIVAGVAVSLGVTRLLRSLLYDIGPTDPLTFAAVCTLLLLVGLAASWMPARRASRVDPVRSLRWE